MHLASESSLHRRSRREAGHREEDAAEALAHAVVTGVVREEHRIAAAIVGHAVVVGLARRRAGVEAFELGRRCRPSRSSRRRCSRGCRRTASRGSRARTPARRSAGTRPTGRCSPGRHSLNGLARLAVAHRRADRRADVRRRDRRRQDVAHARRARLAGDVEALHLPCTHDVRPRSSRPDALRRAVDVRRCTR